MLAAGSWMRRALAAALVFAQLLVVAPAHAVTPAPTGAALLQRAQDLYANGQYGDATTLLIGPLGRGELSGRVQRDARVLVARCFVQVGNTARAKEYFGAVLAAEPGYTLEKSKATAEELDLFRQVQAAHAAAPAPQVGPPAPQAGPPAPATKPAQPPAFQGSGGAGGAEHSGGWLATHKTLAAVLAVGGGGAIVAIASHSGGSSSGGGSTGSPSLGSFPGPPTHHQ